MKVTFFKAVNSLTLNTEIKLTVKVADLYWAFYAIVLEVSVPT
jgi:hypothetical protein